MLSKTNPIDTLLGLPDEELKKLKKNQFLEYPEWVRDYVTFVISGGFHTHTPFSGRTLH